MKVQYTKSIFDRLKKRRSIDRNRYAACRSGRTATAFRTNMSQRSFASAEFYLKRKRIDCEKCLADMQRAVPSDDSKLRSDSLSIL
jgi:hypothetical protein